MASVCISEMMVCHLFRFTLEVVFFSFFFFRKIVLLFQNFTRETKKSIFLYNEETYGDFSLSFLHSAFYTLFFLLLIIGWSVMLDYLLLELKNVFSNF